MMPSAKTGLIAVASLLVILLLCPSSWLRAADSSAKPSPTVKSVPVSPSESHAARSADAKPTKRKAPSISELRKIREMISKTRKPSNSPSPAAPGVTKKPVSETKLPVMPRSSGRSSTGMPTILPAGELIQFSFAGMPYSEILTLIERLSGLPIIGDRSVVAGTADYFRREAMTLDKALEELNLLLREQKVVLVKIDDHLRIDKFPDVLRKISRTFRSAEEFLGAEVLSIEVVRVIFKVRNKPADEITTLLASSLPVGEVTISAWKSINYIQVVGLAGQVRKVVTDALRYDEDFHPGEPGFEVEVFYPKYVRPTLLAKALSKVVPPSGVVGPYDVSRGEPASAAGRRGQIKKPAAGEVVHIIPDDNAGLVIVKAPGDMMEYIKGLVKLIDVPGDPPGQMTTIKLKNAAADTIVKKVLQPFYKASNRKVPATALGKTIVVWAVGAELEELRKLIAELDKEETIPEIRTYQTGQMDANRLAVHLQKTFGKKLGITFSPGPAAGILMVAATAATLEQIAPDIKRIIKQGEQEVVRFQLDRTPAEDVAKLLTTLYGRKGGRLKIVPDRWANIIYISGADALLQEEIKKRIEQIDREEPSAAAGSKIEYLPVEYVSAVEAAEQINKLLGVGVGKKKMPADVPTVEASVSGNTLVVTGTPKQLDRVREWVAEIDKQGQNIPEITEVRQIKKLGVARLALLLQAIVPERTGAAVELIDLELGGTADQIKEQMKTLTPSENPDGEQGRPRIIIGIDAVNNMLFIRSRPRYIEQVDQAIAMFTEDGEARVEHHTYRLEYASPFDVSQSLEAVFNVAATVRRPPPKKGKKPPPRAVAKRRITAIPLERMNAVIVRAEPRDFGPIEELIKELDVPQARNGNFKIFRLKHVRADEIEKALLPMSGAKGRARVRRPGVSVQGETPITVIVSVAAKTVIVQANKSQMRRVEMIIDALDKPIDADEGGLFFVELDRARAERLAPIINNALKQAERVRAAREGARAEPVSVTADAATNTLIVAGSKRHLDQVNDLVARFEKMSPGEMVGSEVKVFPLKEAKADYLAGRLNQMLNHLESLRVTIEGGRRLGVAVTFDATTNSIIVAASMRQLKKAEEIIAELDKKRDGKGPGVEIEVFPLKSGNAQQLAGKISQMLNHAETVRVAREGGPRLGVAVNADPTTNSLIIAASKAQLDLAGNLIAKIMQVTVEVGPEEAISVHLLPLRTSKAEILAPMLNRLFDHAARGTSRRERTPAETVSIMADKRTNSLMVACTQKQFKEIEELVKSIEALQPGGTRRPWVIPLKSIDPNRAKKLLEQLMPRSRSDAGDGTSDDRFAGIGPVLPTDFRAALAAAIAIGATGSFDMPISAAAADTTTDRMVAAVARGRGPTTRARLGKGSTTTRPAKKATARAKRTPPSDAELKTIAGGITGDVDITALPEQGALVIMADEHDFQVIAKILTILDLAMPHPKLEIFKLKNAKAVEIQRVLQQIYRRRRQPRGLPPTTFVAETSSNSIIVSASSEEIDEIGNLIGKLDAEPRLPEVEFNTFTLKNARASQVVPKLQDAIKKILATRGQADLPITIDSDERTNTIIITAPVTYFDQIKRLIKVYDSVPSYATVQIDIIRLLRADAGELGSLLEKLLDPEAQRGSTKELLNRLKLVAEREGEEFTLDLEKPIKVLPDRQSQTIVIMSTPDNLKVLRKIVELFDKVPLVENLIVRVFPLKHADADELADVMGDLFDEGQNLTEVPLTSPRKGGVPENITGRAVAYKITFVPEERTNTILVCGPEASVSLAEVLINQLDKDSPATLYPVHLINLKHAQAQDLQSVLQDIMDRRVDRAAKLGSSKAAERMRVIIRADLRTNTLLVSASPDDLKTLEQLVATLDGAPTQGFEPNLIFLENLEADQAAELLTDLFNRQASARREQKRGGQPEIAPIIIPDARSNSLIIAATTQGLEEARNLIRKLDAAPIAKKLQLAVVPVFSADATQLGNAIMQVLSPEKGARGLRESVILEFIERTKEGRELLKLQAIKKQIFIYGDAATNVLIILAPQETIKLVEALVQHIDQVAPSINIKVFHLKNADAGHMKRTLDELFQIGKSTRSSEAGGAMITVGGVTTGISRMEKEALSITADLRTNALIVTATDSYLKLIEEIVRELEERAIEQLQTKIIELKNAKAKNVEAVISTIVQKRLDLLREVYGREGIAPERLLEQDVIIAADEESRIIILQASPKYMAGLMEIIEALDKQPVMVMIQALLIEVSLDNRTEYGFEWVAQDLAFTKSSGGTGFGSGHDVVVGTGLGAAGTGLAGFTFSLNTEDLNLLFRAIESNGRVSVLSRPQIVAKDNTEGIIRVGQSVPIPAVSNVTAETGNVVTTFTREDVELRLQVTPHVNPNHFVTLEVETEISSISGSNIQIGPGVSAPIFIKRLASTEVTVLDGQTVVMGGLITSTKEKRQTKVPILGDIPLLGFAFRTMVDVEEKTELLIVLTPRIIGDVETARSITETERQFMNLLPDEMKSSALLSTLEIFQRTTTTHPGATSQPKEGEEKMFDEPKRRRLIPLIDE